MTRSRRGAARDGLLVLLTLTTGAVDASCFLHLGNVFSSVITGNLILLGAAAATRSSSLAIHSGTALAGYSVGVLIGAPIATRRASSGETWPLSVTVTLAAEFSVLAGFSAGWELTGGSPGSTAQLLLIAALAAAMGIQSAAVRELGGMSTTYLTGTLTAVITELATRDRKPGLARSLGVLAAIVSGAVGGGLVAEHAPAWLPAVILTPLAVVVIASITFELADARAARAGTGRAVLRRTGHPHVAGGQRREHRHAVDGTADPGRLGPGRRFRHRGSDVGHVPTLPPPPARLSTRFARRDCHGLIASPCA